MEFRLLRADEIESRISTVSKKGVSLLLYKDSRVDMNILDETVGAENWQRHHELIDGQLFCNVGIYVKRETGFGEWVWKQDVGTESYTEKEKGRASDSFKRACFNLGIGRELYTAPFIWFPADSLKKHEQDERGKWTCRDRFVVDNITYVGRKIKTVTIRDTSSRESITFKTDAVPVEESQSIEMPVPTKTNVENLKKVIEKHGLNLAGVLLKANLMTLDNITAEDYNRVVTIVREEAKAKEDGVKR